VVIDRSALLAILFDEEGAEALEEAIEADPVRLMSAASVLETAIVVEARLGDPGGRELDLLLHKAGIDISAVTSDQVEVARHAFRKFLCLLVHRRAGAACRPEVFVIHCIGCDTLNFARRCALPVGRRA